MVSWTIISSYENQLIDWLRTYSIITKVSGPGLLEDTGNIELAGIRGILGDVLQEADDARGLQQQNLVGLHQQTLVTSHGLQGQNQLGTLRTRQQNMSEHLKCT